MAQAKALMRILINHRLEDKPLRSRRVFRYGIENDADVRASRITIGSVVIILTGVNVGTISVTDFVV